MTTTQIDVDVDDHIMTITLDRPDRLNAFTGVMMQEMIDTFDRADADDDVRAIIITGRGRGFCAGADLGSGGSTFDYDDESGGGEPTVHRDGGGLLTLRIFRSRKPVIAAVNGPAVGVGVTMTLPMDIRIASTEARFGFVFARRGIVPEAASSWFLPRLVGIQQATEWAYTGRVFPAIEALEGGLVRSLHEPDELLPAARELAAEIAGNTSGVSVAVTRQMLWRMLGAPHPMEAHRVDSRAIQTLGAMADAREGVESFLEKRPADFTLSVADELPNVFPDWSEPEFS
ncbi:MAG: crotonase/enoyl-CoA hydratase family protein [Actinomycetota bacterium]